MCLEDQRVQQLLSQVTGNVGQEGHMVLVCVQDNDTAQALYSVCGILFTPQAFRPFWLIDFND